MADAEDLKSSGDFSSCGFDSHPGHDLFYFVFNQLRTCVSPRNRRVTLFFEKNDRIAAPSVRQICFQLFNEGQSTGEESTLY